ncbi:helix-turn-helix domain-containing protein [Paraburkholderia sp. BL25I1N1]|uniref:AraC-like ligand-binding domain-containing protein n=1 Tax=Paraburkholderia sp. BL25I1N1 TaxID=1938804 RepID=UPI000D048AFD|nr:helix-turn-helix domain-containing protein [Paraburkholderia sp. BL25I1N1]PRX92043.1 AraC family transcriptional regulator [Paraburkholderia sp. BL25I1N1]
MNKAQNSVVVDELDCVARWEEAVCHAHIQVQTRPMGSGVFNGRLAEQRFGAVLLRHYQSTPVRYVRSASEIDRYPADIFEVSLTLSGTTIIVQNGREIVQRPGDLVIFDAARPFDYALPEGDDQIVVGVPKPLLLQYLPNAGELVGTMLNGTSTFGRLAGTMLRDVGLTGEGAGPAVAARVGLAIVDLVATAFDVECRGASANGAQPKAGALARIKSFILECLADPSLDVEAIATANNVSVRSLHRLFAAEGTTVTRWLWQQRLCASYKALSEGRCNRVSDVAMQFGFTNFSHFARSFKQTFGVLPQSLLRSRLQ